MPAAPARRAARASVGARRAPRAWRAGGCASSRAAAPRAGRGACSSTTSTRPGRRSHACAVALRARRGAERRARSPTRGRCREPPDAVHDRSSSSTLPPSRRAYRCEDLQIHAHRRAACRSRSRAATPPVTDELREHVEKRFAKVGKQVSELADAGGRALRGAQPGQPRRAGRRGDAAPQGRRRCARATRPGTWPTRSTCCADELARSRSSATATSAASAGTRARPRRAPAAARRIRRRRRRRGARAPSGARRAARAVRARGCPALTAHRLATLTAHGPPRPRAAHRRGQAVHAVREARRADQRRSSPSSSSSPTTSCAQRMDGAARARASPRTSRALDDLLPESFALVREAGRRTLGMRHFDVQLIGGMVLHGGTIAEMKTGEGKTLTAHARRRPQRAAPARASTSSRSTTTSPAATPSG